MSTLLQLPDVEVECMLAIDEGRRSAYLQRLGEILERSKKGKKYAEAVTAEIQQLLAQDRFSF